MKFSKLGPTVAQGGRTIFTIALLSAAVGAFAQSNVQVPEKLRPGLKVDGQTLRSEQNRVDPATRALLDQVEAAYKNLHSLSLSGDFVVSVTTTGQVHKVSQPFTGSYEQPNKFRHEMKPDVLVGCDGKNGYVFDQKENAFLRFNFPSNKETAQKIPVGVLSTLLLQDPSLLFAMTDTRVADVLRTFGEAKRVSDVVVDGTTCPVLQFGSEADSNRVRLFIDPQTHLVRRFVLDLKSTRDPLGRPAGGDAAVVVEYRHVRPQEIFTPQHFAWSPPPGATDVLQAAGAEPKDKDNDKSDVQPPHSSPDSFQNSVVP